MTSNRKIILVKFKLPIPGSPISDPSPSPERVASLRALPSPGGRGYARMLSMTPWTLLAPIAAAAGVSAWGTFHPRSQLFGPVVRTAGDNCALTFDDGPNPAVTPRLLALLDKYQVPATFFLLGKYVREHPSLAAEIAARQHAIGNHTFSHPSLVFYSRSRIIEELQR